MNLNRPKHKVVMVWWVDPTAMNEEIDDSTIVSPANVHTYGELVYEDKYMVNILSERFPVDESGRHKTCIPKSNIVKIYTLDIKECILDRTDTLKHFLKEGNH